MILLAIDTSGKNGSLALARVTTGCSETETLEVVPLAGGTFSAQLVPQIAQLLEKHGLQKSDLEGFAVVSGPGSFTGLRVGLAAVKALAEVLQKPIAAISLLALLLFGRTWPISSFICASAANIVILAAILWLQWPPLDMFSR